MIKTNKRLKPVTHSFNTTRNMSNRLERMSKVEGISKTAIILRALEREIWRFEKEYARRMETKRKVAEDIDSKLGKATRED